MLKSEGKWMQMMVLFVNVSDANAALNTGYLHKYANVTFVTAQYGEKTISALKYEIRHAIKREQKYNLWMWSASVSSNAITQQWGGLAPLLHCEKLAGEITLLLVVKTLRRDTAGYSLCVLPRGGGSGRIQFPQIHPERPPSCCSTTRGITGKTFRGRLQERSARARGSRALVHARFDLYSCDPGPQKQS